MGRSGRCVGGFREVRLGRWRVGRAAHGFDIRAVGHASGAERALKPLCALRQLDGLPATDECGRRGVAAFVAATALFAAAVGVNRGMEVSAPRGPDAREAPDLA